MPGIDPPDHVAAVFDSLSPELRDGLLELRELILQTAASTPGVGRIEETLKWGEPAYLTSETRSGSTIRIAPVRDRPTAFGLFFNCQTNLVETFRQWFPVGLKFDANRAICFDVGEPLPAEALRDCIRAALIYHLEKRRSTPRPGAAG